MPKMTRSSHEVKAVREQILLRAFEILVKNGYENLSMAKVGSRMKMTAANLYNYYANKDELLIAIHKKAYAMLYKKMHSAVSKADTPLERFKSMIYAYVEFGKNNVNLYDVMFNRPVRQHSDYIGTSLEAVSTDEFRSSLRVLFLADKVTRGYRETRPNLGKVETKLLTIQIISAIHGIISLHNSGMFSQITDDPDITFKKVIDNAMHLAME
ncbi:MAG TPA: TetR/AcrR family transcriptional regulator [Smithella sp.]|nr:TetR/AcrR family transcriptional regulator [Smithella sp.]